MRDNDTKSSVTADERDKRSAAIAAVLVAGLSIALIVPVWLWTRDVETAVAAGVVVAAPGFTVISLRSGRAEG